MKFDSSSRNKNLKGRKKKKSGKKAKAMCFCSLVTNPPETERDIVIYLVPTEKKGKKPWG